MSWRRWLRRRLRRLRGITPVNSSTLVVPAASVPGRGAYEGLVPKDGRPEPKEGHGSS
jgi:hypothetical protein